MKGENDNVMKLIKQNFRFVFVAWLKERRIVHRDIQRDNVRSLQVIRNLES